MESIQANMHKRGSTAYHTSIQQDGEKIITNSPRPHRSAADAPNFSNQVLRTLYYLYALSPYSSSNLYSSSCPVTFDSGRWVGAEPKSRHPVSA